MATINGLTAERLLQLEADTVIGGHVDGDNLILEQHDGSTINAGSVRGFPSDIDMALFNPPGVPVPYMGAAAPTGWGLCDAATEYDGATYPELAALFDVGTSCINGASTAGKFRLPNLKGRVLVGRDPAVAAFDTLHETGGSKDAVVVQHNHPHDHGGSTDASGDPHDHDFSHTHGANAEVGTGNQIALTDGVAGVASGTDYTRVTGYTGGTTQPSPDATTGPASDFSHQHAIPSDSTNAGVSGTDKNLQPYRVVNYIMRLA